MEYGYLALDLHLALLFMLLCDDALVHLARVVMGERR